VDAKAAAEMDAPMIEVIERNGKRLAEILRAAATGVNGTRFFSPSESSLQLGLMERKRGEVIAAHTHQQNVRAIYDVQETVIVQSGQVAVDFYCSDKVIASITLEAGDAALLADVPVAVRVLEDARCILVKQGPYLGHDKVLLK
jgi:hypothetical protein